MNKESKVSVTKGAAKLQLNENDVVGLVGGIVEKGFSLEVKPMGPPQAPRPSVMPFPVARHRSHGPHWAPKVVKSTVKDDGDSDEGEDGEGKDFTAMELAASAANPVPRKEKKGLDFSRWQELTKDDSSSGLHEKKKHMHSTGMDVKKKVNKTNSDELSRPIGPENATLSGTSLGDHAKEQFMIVDDNSSTVSKDIKKVNGGLSRNGNSESKGSNGDKMEITQQNGSSKERGMVSEIEHVPANHMASGFATHNLVGEEDGSLESQIDAENRARLSRMSVDEIAEAQAEIMSKLNPELLNALKRRSQAKAKRQKVSLSAGSEIDDLQPDKNMSRSTVSSATTSSHEPIEKVAGNAQIQEDNRSSPNGSEENRSMWDAWSKRVERVRDLRFSLDGSVMNSDFAHASNSGTGYSANNVSERDFLRTEGDPGAAGYTIKEAVALTRSVVPGQRTLALYLIAAILDRAIASICRSEVDCASKCTEAEGSIDWEAIWAFALGPEPELVLSLRMSLDDNHNSVVLACAKTIQSVLSCEMNEIIFDIAEKTPTYFRDVCTAPVFRSKPDVIGGFLRGGFWKYNTKPSNIVHFGEEPMDEKSEEEPTIKDDISVAGQDIAAGLVRMGILPRICYLLETDPSAPLEECLISILIAIARHSPTCASAIVNCERLLDTVANRFALEDQLEITTCKIKSVTLLKVLARHEKKNCSTFIQNGFLHKVTWHLYRYPSLDLWLKPGRDTCKLSSALLVEQLRLWKVCVQHGYHLSDFSDLFTSLCNWLSVPSIDKLIEHGVMNEYCAVTKEAYLLLDVLARKLPNFYSYAHVRMEGTDEDKESWSWDHFGSIVDVALEWIKVKRIPYMSKFFDSHTEDSGDQSLQDMELNSVLWVISSVFSMLGSLLKAVIPDDTMSLHDEHLEWLPDFVPRLGLEIVKNGHLRFSELSDTICKNPLSQNGSVVEYLCCLRRKKSEELAISSTCCLQGLVQVVVSVDKLIQIANLDVRKATSTHCSREDKILVNGILKSSVVEVQDLFTNLMKSINYEWQFLQPIEMFGRGGPAPGVGVGWGASGGGYWSLRTSLAQQDVILLSYLLEIFGTTPAKDPLAVEEMGFTLQKLNSALAACLIVGPRNSYVIDQLLKVIFQIPVLKYLDVGIREFLARRKGSKPFRWNYEENEYLLFANVLSTHFRNRWLGMKKKKRATSEKTSVSSQTSEKGSRSLATIHEDIDINSEEPTSLVLEWAHQRLHLPPHWFLSAISLIHPEIKACPPGAPSKENYAEVPSNFLEVIKGGLFFLLGIEAIPTFLTFEIDSPVQCVPVLWKLHALSVVLLSGMDVLQDEKSRDVYETLQNLYGEIIDGKKSPSESLRFEKDIHENYSTFVETLVDQFSAESYGDILFGRQVAIYLHRSVEVSVRLATWNALSNARALELLPPLDKCFTKADGYLEPVENDERLLEAYAKSWVSGALDKAVTRGSMTSSLVLHHLSSFIFGNVAGEMLSLRNKLTKNLLRDYCRKKQHEGMLVKLICYKKLDATLPITSEMEKRLQLLKEICEGNSSLVTAVDELESSIRRDLTRKLS